MAVVENKLGDKKINLEKLLTSFAQDDTVRKMILDAEKLENYLANGIPLINGRVDLYAASNDETGFWEVCLEAEHGKVLYSALDQEGYKVCITTLPNDVYIPNKENLAIHEIIAIQKANSKSIDLDLKDMASLRKAKEFLKDDYVLRNIQLNNPTLDDAARLVIWHIRAYRKEFLDYHRDFNFLWEPTPYKNARSLAQALRVRNLV